MRVASGLGFLLAAVFTASVARADIVIGVALPLTGALASIGEQVKSGTTAAVEAINRQGGVLGQPIKLDLQDDACDPRQAVSVANRFVQAGVKFVVGHVCSGASIAASDLYAEAGVLMVTPASNAAALTERGLATIFRVCGRDDQQGAVAARIIAAKFPGQKIAFIHDKSAFGKGLADATKLNLNKAGVQEAMFDSINAGEVDFSALISRFKQAQIGVVYYGGYQNEAGLLVRQAAEQGYKGVFFGTSGLVSNQFWGIAGAAGNGTLFTFNPDPRKNAEAAEATATLRGRGFEPEGFTLYAYAALQSIAAGIGHAGAATPALVARSLRSEKVATVLGAVKFDAKGDVEAPGYRLYEWRDGKFDYVAE